MANKKAGIRQTAAALALGEVIPAEAKPGIPLHQDKPQNSLGQIDVDAQR